MKRKHWSEYNPNDILYGSHKYGIGVYIINPTTRKEIEYWLDYECALEEEIKRYQEYLKDNNWDE